MADEFASMLEFGSTFKLKEFLATQKIKVLEHMAEEHNK